MPASPDLTPAVPGNPPSDARAARLAKFQREQLIVDYLNRGVSIAEIAVKIGVGEKRMRAVVREILARRMPEAPEEFAAIQLSRLNEALLVAFSAMTDMNLKAVDRVIRIVRELDRYHGRAAALSLPESEALEALAAPPHPALRAAFSREAGEGNALPSPALQERMPPQATGESAHGPDNRPEISPEALEKTESALRFSAAVEAPAAPSRPALRAALSRTPGEGNARLSPAWREGASPKATGKGLPRPDVHPEIPLQPFDKARFTPGPRRLAELLAGGTAFCRVAAEAAWAPRSTVRFLAAGRREPLGDRMTAVI